MARRAIRHATSEAAFFVGREAELALLDQALGGGSASIVSLIGPGGQGKTAIAQHWLQRVSSVDGVFLWSFYRGKEADLCLRAWLACAEASPEPTDVSTTWCVDRLLTVLRQERWAVVLDGAEVAQHETGPWAGRFLHPDLARLLEELANEPMPGVVVLTTRFELPTLQRRPHYRQVSLAGLDSPTSRALLRRLAVQGDEAYLDALAAAAGHHAKAVELLGTWIVHHQGRLDQLPPLAQEPGASPEEEYVARILAVYRQSLAPPLRDLVSLTTAFREPPCEELLLTYLASDAVRCLLRESWGRTYPAWDREWLAPALDSLIQRRLLERVGPELPQVIDAHPLVRRGFEAGQGEAATRAGFLRGRPDRRRPDTLEETRPLVELFHASCDAGLWAEADSALRALENPKQRLLAPVLELELLCRFFPGGDWRKPPLWDGFGRWRSLAICLEMLGRFEDALAAYPPCDAALRGDALLALGRMGPILDTPRMPAPWDSLWQANRCHALCLAGRVEEAITLARSLVPQDIYEHVHVFECLRRTGQLSTFDPTSLPATADNRWAELTRRRLLLEWQSVCDSAGDVTSQWPDLIDAYDRVGLPLERTLTRLAFASVLAGKGLLSQATEMAGEVISLAELYRLPIAEVDARQLRQEPVQKRRELLGYLGPGRG